MIRAFSLYISPLRILSIYFIILGVKYYLNAERLIEQGIEPGLGGLAPWVFAGLSIISLIIDLILSFSLKPKKNWIIQTLLVVTVVIIHVFLMN